MADRSVHRHRGGSRGWTTCPAPGHPCGGAAGVIAMRRFAVIVALGTLLGVFAGVVTASAAAAAHGRYTTIDVPGATATFARSVNDHRVVAGGYTDTQGVSHGFIDAAGCSPRSTTRPRAPHPGRAQPSTPSTTTA